MVALQDESPATISTIAYLNRLSDYLFVAARFANQRAGVEDVPGKGDDDSPVHELAFHASLPKSPRRQRKIPILL